MTSHHTLPRQASLLGLPREIRDMIYELLDRVECGTPGVVLFPQWPTLTIQHAPNTELLRVNRQLHDEYAEEIGKKTSLQLKFRMRRSLQSDPVPTPGLTIKNLLHFGRFATIRDIRMEFDWMTLFWNSPDGELGESLRNYWYRMLDAGYTEKNMKWSPTRQMCQEMVNLHAQFRQFVHPQAHFHITVDLTGYNIDGTFVPVFPNFWSTSRFTERNMVSLERLLYHRAHAPSNVRTYFVYRTPLYVEMPTNGPAVRRYHEGETFQPALPSSKVSWEVVKWKLIPMTEGENTAHLFHGFHAVFDGVEMGPYPSERNRLYNFKYRKVH